MTFCATIRSASRARAYCSPASPPSPASQPSPPSPPSSSSPASRGRRLAASAVVLLALAPLAGCSATAVDRPLIVVTTNILGDVVERVVGDEAEVMTLMQPNADPHSFQISAREAARMLDADLLVSNGLGLEEGLQRNLDAATGEGVPAFVAGDHVETLAYTAGDAAGTADPHLWTDPTRMLDVVDALSATIQDVMAGQVDVEAVQANADDYATELWALDAEMANAFDVIPAERRNLVTNHHVFGYLAERYDFEVIGAVIPSGTTLAAPSASDLASLVTAIERAGVSTIFADSSQPDRLVQVLADEAGIDVAVVDLFTESLSAEGEGAETYLDMMRANTERIATGLSP
ncbi:MAG: zinc transporter substrate-binding protein [Glaciihabitans sp.]|nr:zinc transporter substrate-binding protein [Glaciihabitans sp.]